MRPGPELETERLLLRRWRPEDLEPFAGINADARVMEFFPRLLRAEESAALIARIEAGFERDGYGFWAVEVRDGGAFVGFVGLQPVPARLPFAPAVEIGWRLAHGHWGHGYATEAAREALRFGFEQLGLRSLLAYAVRANRRSRRVMERLGMEHDQTADFDHPGTPAGDPHAPHVVYRLDVRAWCISSQEHVRALHEHGRR